MLGIHHEFFLIFAAHDMHIVTGFRHGSKSISLDAVPLSQSGYTFIFLDGAIVLDLGSVESGYARFDVLKQSFTCAVFNLGENSVTIRLPHTRSLVASCVQILQLFQTLSLVEIPSKFPA